MDRELTPPTAKKIPHIRDVHGEKFVDDYFWLRQRDDPAVIEYLNAENAYADAVLAPTKALAERLYQETVSLVKEDDDEVPYREGQWMYFARTQTGKQYRMRFRRSPEQEAGDILILDENELAKGHEFCGVGAHRPSDDGRLLLYSTNFVGGIDWTLRVRDLDKNQDLPNTIENFRGGEWSADNRSIFYLTHDDAKRAHRLMRHVLGAGGEDALLYEEKDRAYSLDIERSRSEKFIFITSHATDSSEVQYFPAGDPSSRPKVLLPRRPQVEYYADHHGDHVYMRINDTGPNFRIVRAPLADPSPQNWTEIVAHDPNVVIEELDLFANHAVVWERRDALPQVRIIDLRTMQSHHIQFPDAVYEVSGENNRVFDTSVLRVRYESLATPETIYDYDMQTRRMTLLKRREVEDWYDPAKYQTERLFATAKDSTRIPISLVYRKDLRGEGPRPMLLTAYGSYGYSESLDFNASRISLLDRGLIVAIAHIRGGGEYGKTWHIAGRVMNKKNTFTDFIACAEQLIAQRYTTPDKLAISGGSAGGLLMGAVTNMRPDLFKVVVTRVPFVDVINTMLDDSLPLTTLEYTEWGDPHDKAFYDYIRSYSPYENIARNAYPSMFVRGGLNDSQVMYWEPTKYVARLREMKTDSNPLVLRTDMGAGHGGASGRYDKWREVSEYFAFVLWQLDIQQ